jgi:hypothetical protein
VTSSTTSEANDGIQNVFSINHRAKKEQQRKRVMSGGVAIVQQTSLTVAFCYLLLHSFLLANPFDKNKSGFTLVSGFSAVRTFHSKQRSSSSMTSTATASSSSLLVQHQLDQQQQQQYEPVAFSHIHLYVDQLEELHVYKAYEDALNTIAKKQQQQQKEYNTNNNTSFVTHGRDVVQQLLAGVGFRIVAHDSSDAISTLLVASCAGARGVQLLISAINNTNNNNNNNSDQEEGLKPQAPTERDSLCSAGTGISKLCDSMFLCVALSHSLTLLSPSHLFM